MKQHIYHPPKFELLAEWKKYAAGDLREHNQKQVMDKRGAVAKLRIDMREFKFAPLQRERFQFLLGPRFNPKFPHTVKIVMS